MRFSCVTLGSFGALPVLSGYRGSSLVASWSSCIVFCFSPVLGISDCCFILRVWSACGISFSFGALVCGVYLRLPFALFASVCLFGFSLSLLQWWAVFSCIQCCLHYVLAVILVCPFLRLVYLSCWALFPCFGVGLFSSLAFGAFVHRPSPGVIGVFFLALFCVAILVSVVLLPCPDLRFPSRRGIPLGRVRVYCVIFLPWFSAFLPCDGLPFV